ncbi:hypothetical protein Q7A53_06240 [Halobacillus rhizosphaerae]|uniref:hypothetical protein n=1 Tax=Halobacillus rhizosphaerae TaxID=3064889 RepID=UPI00398A617E
MEENKIKLDMNYLMQEYSETIGSQANEIITLKSYIKQLESQLKAMIAETEMENETSEATVTPNEETDIESE